EPRGFVVLRVSIVVATLRMAKLVAREQHRRALGQQHGREKVTLLSFAQRPNLRIIGRAFGAVIPGMVVRMPVAIVLAVGFVVFVVVRDKIVEVEAVMRRDEIYTGPWFAPTLVEEIARARYAFSEFGKLSLITLPIATEGITEFIVPFGPTWRELPDLIAARTDVPRLRDQFDAG